MKRKFKLTPLVPAPVLKKVDRFHLWCRPCRHQLYLQDLCIIFEVGDNQLMIVFLLSLIRISSKKYNVVHGIQQNLVFDSAILFQMR